MCDKNMNINIYIYMIFSFNNNYFSLLKDSFVTITTVINLYYIFILLHYIVQP